MKTIHGLFATGTSVNGWKFYSYSKRIFCRPEDAEKYKPEFVKKCCDSSKFEYCDEPEKLIIKVVEFELEE